MSVHYINLIISDVMMLCLKTIYILMHQIVGGRAAGRKLMN